MLLLLTGPVGGGKSTASVVLAARLRSRGFRTGVIDLDLLYPMAQQEEPRYTDTNVWRVAHRTAAAVADSFFSEGFDVVIVEGGFFTEDERRWVSDHLQSEAELRFVTLDVSLDETIRRVQGDPSPDRVATRRPDVLRWHHEQYMKALPFLRSSTLVVDANDQTPDDLAATISEAVGFE